MPGEFLLHHIFGSLLINHQALLLGLAGKLLIVPDQKLIGRILRIEYGKLCLQVPQHRVKQKALVTDPVLVIIRSYALAVDDSDRATGLGDKLVVEPRQRNTRYHSGHYSYTDKNPPPLLPLAA